MLNFDLSAGGASDIRFGISPLCELGLSLRAIKEPSYYPLQLPWLALTEQARGSIDMTLLMGLIDDRLWTPDFLNPRPESPLTRIGEELAELRELSPERFAQQLRNVHGEVPALYAGNPRRAINRMVDALELYWEVAFARYWDRMRLILEADIVFRGREIARGGLSVMLNGISPNASYQNDVISVSLKSRRDGWVTVGDQGLTMLPTMFSRRVSAPLTDDEPPMILYSARGQGVMWQKEDRVTESAVTALIGRTRTTLLYALVEPASSTELAARFGVTVPAVNQHLRALRDARLVTSTRYGRSVLYFRSELGTSLLAGVAAAG
jgi:DNA-binding transcriptional ArsR family regulator